MLQLEETTKTPPQSYLKSCLPWWHFYFDLGAMPGAVQYCQGGVMGPYSNGDSAYRALGSLA